MSHLRNHTASGIVAALCRENRNLFTFEISFLSYFNFQCRISSDDGKVQETLSNKNVPIRKVKCQKLPQLEPHITSLEVLRAA